MSGLAAIFDFSGRPVLQSKLDAISGGIAHRGADGAGQWLLEEDSNGIGVGIAHAALHTNAEARESTQPLQSECEQCVVAFDGYVSNWEELRTQLLADGALLRDSSDAELLLQAYMKWGADCPRHVDGEYAFVIWDARRKTAFIARDHHGLRPLYYCWQDRRLIVASELQVVRNAMTRSPPLNKGYLAEIMANSPCSNSETVWQGVERLPAAHFMIAGSAGRQIQRYWSVPQHVTIRYRSTADYVDHYRSVLTESVRRASRTDCMLAAELSGGLDSSATYCMAHKLLNEGTLPAPSIAGYTCTAASGSMADEVEYARDAARFAGGALREVPLFQPALEWFASQSARSVNIPNYTNGADSTDLERAMHTDGCRIAMNGIGGDQWLDGSELFVHDSLKSGDWHGLWTGVKADMPSRGIVGAMAFALRQSLVACLPDSWRRAYHRRRLERAGLQTPFWLSRELQALAAERLEQFERCQPNARMARIKQAKHANAQFQLAIELMEQQRASSGIEGRSPMLARAFIEFSAQTPEHIRFRGGTTKFVHREAMQGLMPQSIVKREDKAVFPETNAQRGELLKHLKNALVEEQASELFDKVGLESLIAKYSDDNTSAFWSQEAWSAFCGNAIAEQQRR